MRSSWARLPLILQTCLLIALAPLAYATPVDPLWIPGIYDEADQDDLIGILTADGLAVVSVMPTGAHVVPTKAQGMSPLAESVIIASLRSTLRLRAPPSH